MGTPRKDSAARKAAKPKRAATTKKSPARGSSGAERPEGEVGGSKPSPGAKSKTHAVAQKGPAAKKAPAVQRKAPAAKRQGRTARKTPQPDAATPAGGPHPTTCQHRQAAGTEHALTCVACGMHRYRRGDPTRGVQWSNWCAPRQKPTWPEHPADFVDAFAAHVRDGIAAGGAPDPNGITPKQKAFADEYLRDLNGTAAYLRLYPNVTYHAAGTEAWRMLKSAELRTYIDTQRERKALEVDFTKTDWLREMVAQVRANPDEVTQIRLVSCDACWEAAPGERQPMWQEPNPDCAHCQGDGIPRAWFADTRKLSPGARRLFQSVQQTKDGLRVHLRDQDAALVNLGKALGVFELDNRQKNVSLAEALQGFIGGLHSQARIKTVRTPGKQGTAGKTQAEPNPEPNGNPVGSESVPRNPLVKG